MQKFTPSGDSMMAPTSAGEWIHVDAVDREIAEQVSKAHSSGYLEGKLEVEQIEMVEQSCCNCATNQAVIGIVSWICPAHGYKKL